MKELLLLGRTLARFVLRAVALLTIASSIAIAETPGEYFRNYIAKRDAECKELQLGPYMPADEPPLSPRRGNHSCHSLFLKPWWENLDDAGKFAHSIKLPPPHDKLTDVYKLGMSPRDYFDALCAAHAGEFIFRTVENVAGIIELRPRPSGSGSAPLTRHLTAYEDPANADHWFAFAPEFLVRKNRYHSFQRNSRKTGELETYFKDQGTDDSIRVRETRPADRLRYGYLWRGLDSPAHIENGISGGEYLVIDSETKEVLALRRGFKFRWLGRYGAQQSISETGIEWGTSCSQEKKITGRESLDLLLKVLNPIK